MRKAFLVWLLFCAAILRGQQKGDQLSAEQIAKKVQEGTGSMTVVFSTPPGADIVLDGKLILHTPARFLMEKKGNGTRTLVVTMAGYKPFEQKVEVKGQPVLVNVKFEKLDSAAPSTNIMTAISTAASATGAMLPPPLELKAPPEGVTPYDIKGVKLGGLLTEWQQQNPADCTRKLIPALVGRNLNGVLDCLNTFHEYQTTYAGFPVESMMVTFYGQRLTTVSFSFKAGAYNILLDSLKEKFGKSSDIATETYQNAFGATYSGTVVTWSNGVTHIILSEISGDRDHCGLTFWHDELMLERERGTKPKVNIKDM